MNLHENKNNILRDYTETEMEGIFLVGDLLKDTHLKFRKITEYYKNVESTDVDCDSADSVFNGKVFKRDTRDFSKVNRCQLRRVNNFEQDVIEVIGKH